MLGPVVMLAGVTVVVVLLAHRLKLPGIVGFLLTGVLVGPQVLGVIRSSEDVSMLAEMGVVALLFTIGLELSLQRLWEMRSAVLVGGGAQVILTIAATMLMIWRTGQTVPTAIFAGFLVALSSTAVVLSLLQQQGQMQTPHGRATLGILLFQDLAVVPMMLVAPYLAGGSDAPGTSVMTLLGKLTLLVVLMVGARWLVPALLHRITRTRDRELFMLTVVFVGLSVALLTAYLGLSLALGAFLAGLIISESEYGHRALSSILPLRDGFTSFFFISVGMLLDVGYVADHAVLVLGATLGLMLLKALTGLLAGLILRLSVRTAVLATMALAQIGEFSFVLHQVGVQHHLLPSDLAALFLAVAVASLLLTPAAMVVAPRAASLCQRLPWPRWVHVLETDGGGAGEAQSGHLVIIGYGFNGSSLARMARRSGIPYAIVEMNPDTVRRERARDEPIHYGDATQAEVLLHVGADRARVIVIAISDAGATRATVELVRRLSPEATVIARTRFMAEVDDLRALGADEVIPEEFETGVEIFSRVMHRYLVPTAEIAALVGQMRAGNYQMLRPGAGTGAVSALETLVAGDATTDLATMRLRPRSSLVGQDLRTADVRRRFAVNVLALVREGQAIANPSPEEVMQAGDSLIVMGPRQSLLRLTEECHLEPEGDAPGDAGAWTRSGE